MFSNVSKWGNSLGVRIPRSIAEQIGISDGAPIELVVENDHIVIQKVYRLESLLSKITPKNIHSEVDAGSSVGAEVW